MSFVEKFSKMKCFALMLMLQFGYSGMYIISVASLKQGMNHYVLVVYRNLVAVLVVAPFALWFERKGRPKMNLRTFAKILGLAILEPVLDQNLYYMGANLTSAGFASALYNILPAITFLMAIILRIERLNVRERRSQAKVVGTLVTVAGAVLMILYKGPAVEFFWTKGRSHHGVEAMKSPGNWLAGTFMLIGSCCSWATFFILQSNTLESYPAQLTLTTLICLIGSGISAAIALTVERGSAKPWIIGFDTRLVTVVYSGIMCSGLAYYVQGVVMKERGPVFVTAFNPICMIITAILGSIILAEEITVGSLIGAAIIVIGLYSLIWGKSKDVIPNKSSEISSNGKVFELPVTSDEKTESYYHDHSLLEVPAPKGYP